MRSIRIGSLSEGVLGVDIGCKCGNTSIPLKGSTSMFKHRVEIDNSHEQGVCENCGRRIRVKSQYTDVHIYDDGVPESH